MVGSDNAMTSPTQRSLLKLREAGFHAEVVERWNSIIKRRMDLWGFADILAIDKNETRLVQATTMEHVPERIRKIRDCPLFYEWIKAPHRTVFVYGWAKRGPRGRRKLWQCRVVRLFEIIDEEINPLLDSVPVLLERLDAQLHATVPT